MGLQNGDEITASYSTVATPGSKVGDYAIVPAAVDSAAQDLANYTVTLVNGTLRVTKAELTITADDQSKVYGDGEPGADRDDRRGCRTATRSPRSYSTVATRASPVGELRIVPAAVDAARAWATTRSRWSTRTLVVGKAVLTVTADDQDQGLRRGEPAADRDGDRGAER